MKNGIHSNEGFWEFRDPTASQRTKWILFQHDQWQIISS